MSTLKVTHLQNESNAEPAITITSAGAIGIGTETPRDPVHIFHPTNNVNLLIESGDANSYLAFRDNATTSDTAVYLGAEGNDLKFITSGTERFRIDSDGKVFIGSTSEHGPSAYNLANAGLSITAAGENVLRVLDSTSYAADVGGAILIGGNYRSTGDTQPFVELKSFKENGTNTNYAYGFRIGTTPNGGSITERLRITSAGNIGIGTDNPTKALHIAQNSDCAIRIDANNSNTNARTWEIVVGGNASNNAEMVLRTRQDNGTGGSECARFTRNGGIKLPSGGGIDFHNYGTGANIDSNLLDDYEEGTWTPQARDNFSSGNQGSFDLSVGYYTKIGNQVTVWGRFSNVDTSGMTAGFDFCVAGLPFAASSNLTFATGTIHTNFFTFSGQINPRIEGARSSFRIQECASGSNNDFVTVSQVSSGTADAFFVLTYFV
tara:strand:+ start:3796 stop:5100 length:1305 start_codon:yes stop_codon:yes gene_type:complete